MSNATTRPTNGNGNGTTGLSSAIVSVETASAPFCLPPDWSRRTADAIEAIPDELEEHRQSTIPDIHFEIHQEQVERRHRSLTPDSRGTVTVGRWQAAAVVLAALIGGAASVGVAWVAERPAPRAPVPCVAPPPP